MEGQRLRGHWWGRTLGSWAGRTVDPASSVLPVAYGVRPRPASGFPLPCESHRGAPHELGLPCDALYFLPPTRSLSPLCFSPCWLPFPLFLCYHYERHLSANSSGDFICSCSSPRVCLPLSNPPALWLTVGGPDTFESVWHFRIPHAMVPQEMGERDAGLGSGGS